MSLMRHAIRDYRQARDCNSLGVPQEMYNDINGMVGVCDYHLVGTSDRSARSHEKNPPRTKLKDYGNGRAKA